MTIPSGTALQGPVGVVGLGLIGGSIALDLRARGVEVRALVHRTATARRARQRALADRVATDPAVLADCRLVVLALPLDQLLEPAPDLLAALPPEAVITDVGSVKAPVLERWQPLHPRFVASHPMAGTTQAGVEAGVRDLFVDRPWLATPGPGTDPEALAQVRALALALGARWHCCGAAAHDQAVALISHLPVLVSAALLLAADRGAAAGPGAGDGLQRLCRPHPGRGRQPAAGHPDGPSQSPGAAGRAGALPPGAGIPGATGEQRCLAPVAGAAGGLPALAAGVSLSPPFLRARISRGGVALPPLRPAAAPGPWPPAAGDRR